MTVEPGTRVLKASTGPDATEAIATAAACLKAGGLVAFAAWNRGVELIGANRSGPFLHLVPICTALVGGVVLGEHLAAFHVAGFVLIIAGVWLASKRAAA